MDNDTAAELSEIKERLDVLETTLESVNTSLTELVEIHKSVQGFLTVMKWAERISIWFAKIAAFLALIYAILKHGKLPPGST